MPITIVELKPEAELRSAGQPGAAVPTCMVRIQSSGAGLSIGNRKSSIVMVVFFRFADRYDAAVCYFALGVLELDGSVVDPEFVV